MKRSTQKIEPTKSAEQLAQDNNALARDHVNRWIEEGVSCADMDTRARVAITRFRAALYEDIRLFNTTGKYPKWAKE